MGKRKIFKIVFVILSIFLCVAFYELFGICIAYKKQPEVSNTIKKETVYTGQTEHTARRFSAYLPPIQCTLSGHQCMMLIQV